MNKSVEDYLKRKALEEETERARNEAKLKRRQVRDKERRRMMRFANIVADRVYARIKKSLVPALGGAIRRQEEPPTRAKKEEV